MIDGSGALLLTIPSFVSDAVAHAFIHEQRPWISQQLKRVRRLPRRIPVGLGKPYTQYKEEARKLIEERIKQYNEYYQFPFKRISIRNQKSRWGSCSKKGNLSFNYRLLFLPLHLVDYVVVHELCHLKELNHSKRFWSLVAHTMPRYKEYRRQMRGKYSIA